MQRTRHFNWGPKGHPSRPRIFGPLSIDLESTTSFFPTWVCGPKKTKERKDKEETIWVSWVLLGHLNHQEIQTILCHLTSQDIEHICQTRPKSTATPTLKFIWWGGWRVGGGWQQLPNTRGWKWGWWVIKSKQASWQGRRWSKRCNISQLTG